MTKRKPRRAGIRQGPRILAIVREAVDRTVLEAISRNADWTLTFEDTFDGDSLGEELPPIVLYDRRVPGHEWRQVVRTISRTPSGPGVILLSPTSDRNLWDELERVGGSDVLRSPIEPEQARLAVNRAWMLWRNQQHVRLPADFRPS